MWALLGVTLPIPGDPILGPCTCLETLTDAGVTAVVHPGGSVGDEQVTEAAATAGITLYLTGAQHFAH